MALRERARVNVAEPAELRRTVEESFLVSMHAELHVIRTLCFLAEQEDGEKRVRHVRLAEKAFETALELAKRVPVSREDRDAIEDARHNICRLVALNFCQPHD